MPAATNMCCGPGTAAVWFIIDQRRVRPRRQVFDLAVNPSTPTTVLAATDSGVYRTLISGDW